MEEPCESAGRPSRPRATSWQRTPLERVTDQQIDALELRHLGHLIGLFEQFLEERNPPTKKMMVAARLERVKARRDAAMASGPAGSPRPRMVSRHLDNEANGESGAPMTANAATPSRPGWANERTAVVAEVALVGPVAERGDRLYAGLVELLQVSLVKTLGELRAGASANEQLEEFLETYEDNRAFAQDEPTEDVEPDPDEGVRSELIEWYVERLPAPWMVDGGTGWELDELVARFGSASGASPGGHADWIQFSIEVDELASHLRDLGFETVRVPSRVFEQFLGFPVDGIWLDEGEPLLGSPDGQV